ncbi:MAG TPA: mismatch-specific DNA-glycosylase [Stellaceae bacterium]|jgi:TDG/mug DNA glycosylase family protein|nr:mismatch-specific DNA-glycosylase [Stellaceae bacterium]
MAKPLATLPDLLRAGLDVVFVGINPSVFSAVQGHYFARKINRFWPAFSRSRLSLAAREGLGVERLEPIHDRALQAYGFGFTDLVKRASPRATDLTRAEPGAGVAALARKLKRYQPRFACFHGVTVGRPVQRVLAPELPEAGLGLQPYVIGETRIFVVPNPSPANAHFTPADQTRWYDALADALAIPRRG